MGMTAKPLRWRITTLDRIALAVTAVILVAFLLPLSVGEVSPSLKAVRLSNVKQVDLALIMYENDHDDKAGDMRDAARFKVALFPYLKSEETFVDPESKEPILPNPQLSFQSMRDVDEPPSVIAIYSPVLEKNGTRGVGYVDGHAKDIPEEQFIGKLLQTRSLLETKKAGSPKKAAK